jgi:hypothetical protein
MRRLQASRDIFKRGTILASHLKSEGGVEAGSANLPNFESEVPKLQALTEECWSRSLGISMMGEACCRRLGDGLLW